MTGYLQTPQSWRNILMMISLGLVSHLGLGGEKYGDNQPEETNGTPEDFHNQNLRNKFHCQVLAVPAPASTCRSSVFRGRGGELGWGEFFPFHC